jgi:hypothetical protein
MQEALEEMDRMDAFSASIAPAPAVGEPGREQFIGLMTGQDPAEVWKRRADKLAAELDTSSEALAAATERAEKKRDDYAAKLTAAEARIKELEGALARRCEPNGEWR